MAQFGRALRSGRRGRWFKSSRIDFLAEAPENDFSSCSPVFCSLIIPDWHLFPCEMHFLNAVQGTTVPVPMSSSEAMKGSLTVYSPLYMMKTIN